MKCCRGRSPTPPRCCSAPDSSAWLERRVAECVSNPSRITVGTVSAWSSACGGRVLSVYVPEGPEDTFDRGLRAAARTCEPTGRDSRETVGVPTAKVRQRATGWRPVGGSVETPGSRSVSSRPAVRKSPKRPPDEPVGQLWRLFATGTRRRVDDGDRGSGDTRGVKAQACTTRATALPPSRLCEGYTGHGASRRT